MVKSPGMTSLATLALLTPATLFATGFNNSGAVHITGPNGLDTYGAYQFIMPSGQPGQDSVYQFKLVLFAPIAGYAPDLVYLEPVRAWGDPAGHYWWSNGVWTLEMVAQEETIRQQVSWEAEKMGYKPLPGPGSVQRVDVTIGRDTILLTVTKRGN